MNDLKHANMLLALAQEDQNALVGMGDTKVFSNAIFGFHVQQTTEKALKAWLIALGIDYPRTHDLRLLFQLLKHHGEGVDSFFDLIEFNAYAVQFRYEAITDDEPISRDEAAQTTHRLIQHVSNILQRRF